MKENKTPIYILTTALAVSLGVNATLVAGGVQEVQASPKQECKITNMTLTVVDKACFESCLDGAICSSVDSALGLSGANACASVKHATSFSLQWQRGNATLPDTTSLSGTTCHDGNWNPGPPQ